jgi:uncharacterized protein (DUF488 family)
MKTSYFKYYNGDNGVAVCLFPPLTWTGPVYNSLAPRRSDFYAIKRGLINEEQYEENYKKYILSKLNPKEVYEELKDSVLLCFETSDEFCHRHIISKWIWENLKIEVTEWNKLEEKLEKRQKNLNPLF